MLRRAWLEPFSVKSDFARTAALGVAAASSLGFITTRQGPADFGRHWLITPAGLANLWLTLDLDE